MDALKLQAAKLNADHQVARVKLSTTLREAGKAKAKEKAASAQYQKTVDRILRDPERLARAIAHPHMHLSGLKTGRHQAVAAKTVSREVSAAANREQKAVLKLSEKLEAVNDLQAVQKRLGMQRRENLMDEELLDLSLIQRSVRLDVTADYSAPFSTEVKSVKEVAATSGLSAVVTAQDSQPFETKPVIEVQNTPQLPPINDLQVTKVSPGEVNVGFQSVHGERVSLSIAQMPNGSVSLSWQGFAAHAREIQAIESSVLKRLRDAGIRPTLKRQR